MFPFVVIFLSVLALLFAITMLARHRIRQQRVRALNNSFKALESSDGEFAAHIEKPTKRRRTKAVVDVSVLDSTDLVQTWAQFNKQLYASRQLEAEKVTAREQLDKMPLPEAGDAEAIDQFLTAWQALHLNMAKIALELEEFGPVMQASAKLFIDAWCRLERAVYDIDCSSLLPEDVIAKIKNVRTILGVSRYSYLAAEKWYPKEGINYDELNQLNSGQPLTNPEPPGGWQATINNLHQQQRLLLVALVKFMASYEQSKLTYKTLSGVSLNYVDPIESDAGQAYQRAIEDWYRQYLHCARAHNRAAMELKYCREAASTSILQTKYIQTTRNAPTLCIAANCATGELVARIETLEEELTKTPINQNYLGYELAPEIPPDEPLPDEKNLVAALRAQTRALTNAIIALRVAEEKQRTASAPDAPDLFSDEASSPESIRKRMRALQEWSRRAVKYERGYARLGEDVHQRRKQRQDAITRLQETIRRIKDNSEKARTDELLILLGMAARMAQIEVNKDKPRSASRW